MTALDTNVLVRFITRDDAEQARQADRLLSQEGTVFFILDAVLIELYWTLRRLYEFEKEQVVEVVDAFTRRGDVEFEDRERLAFALDACKKGHDLADALILGQARAQGCKEFVTFDERLRKLGPDWVKRPSGR